MKKAIFILIVIVLLFIINGLLHSIFDLWQKQDLLVTAQKQLDAEKLKNSKLKGQLSYVQNPQYIDETAHNKLFLAKPGEQQVLIQDGLNSKTQIQTKVENIPNWQKWINLFF